jgi:hypothetical protein
MKSLGKTIKITAKRMMIPALNSSVSGLNSDYPSDFSSFSVSSAVSK